MHLTRHVSVESAVCLSQNPSARFVENLVATRFRPRTHTQVKNVRLNLSSNFRSFTRAHYSCEYTPTTSCGKLIPLVKVLSFASGCPQNNYHLECFVGRLCPKHKQSSIMRQRERNNRRELDCANRSVRLQAEPFPLLVQDIQISARLDRVVSIIKEPGSPSPEPSFQMHSTLDWFGALGVSAAAARHVPSSSALHLLWRPGRNEAGLAQACSLRAHFVFSFKEEHSPERDILTPKQYSARHSWTTLSNHIFVIAAALTP